jgi:predicted Rossmann-fold nucleotide-binding protein
MRSRPNLEERKRLLQSPSDCFIALPGGVGTFEEIWEMASLEALGLVDALHMFAKAGSFSFWSPTLIEYELFDVDSRIDSIMSILYCRI